MLHNHFNSWKYALLWAKLYGEGQVYFGTSLPPFELSDKGSFEKSFALSKLDRKTFPSYSSSALYVSVPGYYFSIILIDFLKIKDRWLELLTKSNTSKANCSTRIVYTYIYSYTVSVSVKQLYKSYDLFINK